MNFVFLSPDDMLEYGIEFLHYKPSARTSKSTKTTAFKKFYGSSPLVLSNVWYDMCTTDIEECQLNENERKLGGFKRFMIANYFLWTYPRNSHQLACVFGMCERYSRGKPLWKWIQKIAAMRQKKIVWDPCLDRPDTEIFVVTVDGTDFRLNEVKHERYPIDRQMCSHKYNHASVKYEIAISIFRPKCVWINGPFRGGMNDMDIFRMGLKQKIAHGKIVVADQGYRGKDDIEPLMISVPNKQDSKELNKFKSRARARHESFNGRLKFYQSLNTTFRHGFDKHKCVFEADCVLVQYLMYNGAEIFVV